MPRMKAAAVALALAGATVAPSALLTKRGLALATLVHWWCAAARPRAGMEVQGHAGSLLIPRRRSLAGGGSPARAPGGAAGAPPMPAVEAAGGCPAYLVAQTASQQPRRLIKAADPVYTLEAQPPSLPPPSQPAPP